MTKKINHNFNQEDQDKIKKTGLDFSQKTRSASFIQQDNDILFNKSLLDGIEIEPIEAALNKYPQIKEKYYGKAFKELNKEYPKETVGGYFIRIKKGKKVEFPIQSCLFLKNKKFKQKVHNIIVAEEGAQAHIITGCASAKAAEEAYHLGISEFFVEKNAYLNFTMIHRWEKDIEVKPMSVAIVSQGGSFVSNYICLNPVRDIKMYPTAVLAKDCKATFSSLMVAYPNCIQDIGSRVIFKEPGASAEIISRAVSLGGEVIARGDLDSKAAGIKAHLECRGLIVTETGKIHAIPELKTKYRDVDMSHEAAIGKISKDEINYLRARGIPKEEAQSLIIRGFVDVNILALPEELRKEVDKLADQTLESGL
ncbi:MAG: SufD family Fe-S cluster assembly protein [Candidatus Omnitrophica bacterium]|nr:SufD family Fe-S cluster assembly protein [Candidatus Omnitrophota bacterium]MCF7894352.1 SufD family Fe-S cluster assembly protein [Candidatus Omnitrophota bacterium]